jgi:hypothetical protein
MFKPKSSDDQINNQEAGYTILEAIIAILIVTVLMSVVAPVIGFSVGTRVSAKRIELASQAARSYLDWVKVDPSNRGPNRSTIKDLEQANPPDLTALSAGCTVDGSYCDGAHGRIFCVDGDGDGMCKKDSLKDMIVQGVSWNGSWQSATDYTRGYKLGIRVYRADAFNETELKTETSSTSVNNVGGDRRYPLVTLTTEIAPTEDSFNNLKNRLQQP